MKDRRLPRAVAAIAAASFFSDFSHEMATAVLPMYLGAVGLGPAALGVIEGVSDFLVSVARLAGGVAGHHLRRRRIPAAAGYLTTTLATAAIAFVKTLPGVAALRGAAWAGRGFRSPLRDHLLAEAVEPARYGRAFGLERTGDMLGAVAGPLGAALLLGLAFDFPTILLFTVVPGLVATGAMFFFTRAADRPAPIPAGGRPKVRWRSFPRPFCFFLIGVLLFGLGDFSRTFLILLAAGAAGAQEKGLGLGFALPILLYAGHNLVSGFAAYPVGRLGDRHPKMQLLVSGYGIGVATNLLLAAGSSSLAVLIPAVLLSGIYISVEETLEKAVAAELLPSELRSLGFGALAAANAVGDLTASLYLGFLLQAGRPGLAFGLAAAFGLAGVLWLLASKWIHEGEVRAGRPIH